MQKLTGRLTEEMITELDGKSIEDRQKALTILHQEGYNIKPYLEKMLTCSDRIHCGPKDQGFKFTYFADDKLWIYNLDGGKTAFFYQELENKTYKPWLS